MCKWSCGKHCVSPHCYFTATLSVILYCSYCHYSCYCPASINNSSYMVSCWNCCSSVSVCATAMLGLMISLHIWAKLILGFEPPILTFDLRDLLHFTGLSSFAPWLLAVICIICRNQPLTEVLILIFSALVLDIPANILILFRGHSFDVLLCVPL